jgi:hypothetical protein
MKEINYGTKGGEMIFQMLKLAFLTISALFFIFENRMVPFITLHLPTPYIVIIVCLDGWIS